MHLSEGPMTAEKVQRRPKSRVDNITSLQLTMFSSSPLPWIENYEDNNGSVQRHPWVEDAIATTQK